VIAALQAAESVRFLHTGPDKIIITTLTGHHSSVAPQTPMRSLAIRSRNVYRIDQDPSFLRIDADILRP
jgi:hypothetical protein